MIKFIKNKIKSIYILCEIFKYMNIFCNKMIYIDYNIILIKISFKNLKYKYSYSIKTKNKFFKYVLTFLIRETIM